MELGLIYEMQTPRPWSKRSESNTYHEALAQIELADRVGMDAVWAVEHHFLEEYSHCSAPEVFFGAVSQRTRQIRICHGVRLLPHRFNHPIKVAEQAAVLDILSNGRMELGTGRSTTAQELDGFGVDYDRTRLEVREALDVIVKAFTEDYLEYEGQTIRVPRRMVLPKPIQEPHPPMWMACVAPDSYLMAADRGLGVLSFTFNFDAVASAAESYRAKCRTRSDLCVKLPNERFATVILAHVAESAEEEAIGLQAARYFLHEVAKLFAPLMAKNELYSYEYLRGLFGIEKDANEMTDAELKQHPAVVVGNPDEVIRKLEAFRKIGVDQALMFKQSGGAPHASLMRSIQRVGGYVVPHFQPHKRGALALGTEENPIASMRSARRAW